MDDVQGSRGEAATQRDPATPAEERHDSELCAMEGCENAVSPPALDEQGRRRGGRPPAYCCKAHADLASRLRRARETAAVADPLREVRAIGERVLPAVRGLADALGELTGRFDAAESGALGEVAAAQQESARALRDSEEARRRAERAERQRAEALARARDDREAAVRAEREAEQQRRAADQTRTQAWEEVARHERLRGQAEASRHAAEAARDELAGQLRATREETATLRATHTDLVDRFAETEKALAEATTARSVLAAQLDAAGERAQAAEAARDTARGDAARTREELTATRDALDQAWRELAEERAARHVAEARATDLGQALAQAEKRADTAEARVRELAAHGDAARPDGHAE